VIGDREIADREIAGRINVLIGPRYGTLLVGGAPEPEYLPPVGRRRAIIRYTRDYARSVLHEIAHWCLADPVCRALPDYGLSYVAPPRAAPEQAAFFAGEERVQALESILALACGLKFQVSADQIGEDVRVFEQKVAARAHAIRRRGLCGCAREVLDAVRTPGQAR
jgi:elongation factor P hydroxylase